MIAAALLVLTAEAPAANMVPDVVGGLEGCWAAPGQVLGKDSTSVARGEWHLGKRYFTLHLRSVPPAEPYEAAISFGAGERPGEIGSFWQDTFGGMYLPSLGLGAVTANGFALDYQFPDAAYANAFVRSGNGWTWTITEKPKSGPNKLFARYDLSPMSCDGVAFDY